MKVKTRLISGDIELQKVRQKGYFQQQFCTEDPALHLFHQKDRKEQDHIAGSQR